MYYSYWYDLFMKYKRKLKTFDFDYKTLQKMKGHLEYSIIFIKDVEELKRLRSELLVDINRKLSLLKE